MIRIGASLALALVLSGGARGEILLKAANLPGGNFNLPAYQGWIPLNGIGFSIDRELAESGEKGGTEDINIGVGEMSRFHLTKPVGDASAELFQYAINGNTIGVADVRVEGFGAPIGLTCSIGVASSDALGVWGEHLIARADEAVYVAKRAGRNRVQVAAPLPA